MRAPPAPDEREEPAASVRVRVRLFGGLDVRVDDQPAPPIESARARSLLGHLLLHSEVAHARQRLAFLLWPDSTEGQARTNLRNVLHTLRRSNPGIERLLVVTPQTLQWRPGMSCWVDTVEFASALAAADTAEPGSHRMVAALRRAVELHHGDLLDGCYDEWLVEERERYRDRYASALWRLAELLAARGESVEAIRLGRELVRCDPLREEPYRLLMRVHDAAGDRAAAVRVYHECAATLQRELGVEPSVDTRAIHAKLMRPTATSAAEPVRISGGLLVGRDPEWDQLTRCWCDAEEGRSQLVLVTGEPGIGKTRLVEELGAWCAHRGALVAHARAYPAEGELGYGTVISWLRSADLATQLRRAGPAESGELALLLPELGFGAEVVATATDDGERRRRLFAAVDQVLAASDRPTLLVADDAQWADAQSLQLIHYLVRADRARPLLIVATVRREELPSAHPFSDLVRGLQIIERSTEIPLDRLTRSETEALARSLAAVALGAERLDELFADTEGNPLFIVESIRAGDSRGEGTSSGLSPKLQAVISARLRQLSDPARHLLDLAATIGRAFTAELLGQVAAVDDLTLVGGLDELWRRGFIREHGSDSYDFSHGKIRDVAYESLSQATRRRTHELVAEALQRIHRQDLDAVSGRVATNYDQAGHAAEAAAWYVRATRQAQRLYASHEAVRLLERARVLVAALPGEVHRCQELEILSAMPAPLVGVASFASERLDAVHHRALELATMLRVEPEPPLLRSLVMASLCRDDFDEARAAASRLRDSASRIGDVGLGIEAEYLLGITTFWSAEFEAARAHFEQVVGRFERDQSGEHLVRFGHDPAVVSLSRLANTLWFLGHDTEARRARDRAVAMAATVGHPLSTGTAHSFAALLSLDLGEQDRVRAYATALATPADRSKPIEINADVFAGYLEVLDGHARDGIQRIRAAIEASGPRNHAPGFRAVLMRVLVGAHAIAADPAAGLKAADEALQLGGSRIWEAEIRRLRAEFLAALTGDRAAVEAELARAIEVARRQGAGGLERRVEASRLHLTS